MKLEFVEAKSLIRKSNRSPYHYHFNLYQGCEHNCVYCDGRSEGYFIHKEYGTEIKAKINAPEMFERFLRKKGLISITKKMNTNLENYFPNIHARHTQKNKVGFIVSLFGNVCDVYQPVETELQLTRRILQIAYDYCVPIRLLTKSDLVLRDIELIEKINNRSFARVAFTITLANLSDQLIFEPNASPTNERFKAMQIFSSKGISTGAYITPIIPFIGDTEENLHKLYKNLQKAKADFVVTGGLTLKPGRNKDIFFKAIKHHYPQLFHKFKRLYSNNNQFGQPDNSVAEEYQLVKPIKRGYELSREYNIHYYEPRYIPQVPNKTNLEVSTILARIAFLKRDIYEESYKESLPLLKSSSIIEYLQRDINTMSIRDMKNEGIEEQAFPHILEYRNRRGNAYLERIEDISSLFVHRP
ncbi:MAG: radical SAM protein [Candidatus Heimdallarchaeaceae archaeon]